MLLIGVAVGNSLARRPCPLIMQRAGEAFVIAFARPLIDSSSSGPPIQARLRFVRRAQQLEISIAPGAGRRYPNLVDHKRNVEYDVNRVMRVLGAPFVVSDRLRAEGKWVVVPIRLADLKQTGANEHSSCQTVAAEDTSCFAQTSLPATSHKRTDRRGSTPTAARAVTTVLDTHESHCLGTQQERLLIGAPDTGRGSGHTRPCGAGSDRA